MSKKITIYIFTFLLFINFASTGGHFDSHDGVLYYLVAENMVLKSSIKLDPSTPSIQKLDFNVDQHMKSWAPQSHEDYVNGTNTPFYVGGGILGPALAVPWYALALGLGLDPIHVVPFFTNSVILSLTGLIVFMFSRDLFRSEKIAFVTTIIFSVTSFVWPYNTTFFLQPAQGLTLISSLYFIYLADKNRFTFYSVVSGILLGTSIMIHPSSLIFIPGVIGFSMYKIRKNKKNILFFLSSFAVVTSLQFIINYVKYNSFLDFGYQEFGSASVHNDWTGFVGMIFSPGWGLIFYFPITILFPIALSRMFKKDKALFFVFIYSFLAVWIFFGTESSPHWSGFGSWGPRYFIPVLPLVSLSIGYLLTDLSHKPIFKISVIVLASCGFMVNLVGSLVWYMTGYNYAWNVDKLVAEGRSFDYFAWTPYVSPIIEHAKVLATNYGSLITNPITNSIGCPVDIFLYCTIGIIPIIIMLAFVATLGFLILKNLQKVNLPTKI